MDDREAHEFYADPANLAASGPSRKRSGERLTTMASVRFAPEVIEAVKRRASGDGVTVGSWIRRLVDREVAEPRTFDLAVDGEGEPVRIPADALERVLAAMMPTLMRRGSLRLQFGDPAWRHDGPGAVSSLPLSVARPEALIEDSGRRGSPRSIPSSHWVPRTFSCPHLSIGGVVAAECQQCGPLAA